MNKKLSFTPIKGEKIFKNPKKDKNGIGRYPAECRMVKGLILQLETLKEDPDEVDEYGDPVMIPAGSEEIRISEDLKMQVYYTTRQPFNDVIVDFIFPNGDSAKDIPKIIDFINASLKKGWHPESEEFILSLIILSEDSKEVIGIHPMAAMEKQTKDSDINNVLEFAFQQFYCAY